MNSIRTLDLIICTYNNAALLRQTLAALEALQSPAALHWSVVVIDNNCTDDTPTVIEEFLGSEYLHLRCVTENEQGLTPARRRGVQESGADWIAFIDDDCLLAPDWLQQAVYFIAVHPQCALMGGKICLQWEATPPAYVHRYPFAFAGRSRGAQAKKVQTVAGAGMLANRKALYDCGWVEQPLLPDRIGKSLVSGGDVEICLRVGQLYEVWYNPACVLQHLIPERRTTTQYLQRMLFGLGVSRHHTAALQWKGSYTTWFPYSMLYAVGMLFLGLKEGWEGRHEGAGWKVANSSFRGWCGGMKDLWAMPNERRKALVGGSLQTANKKMAALIMSPTLVETDGN